MNIRAFRLLATSAACLASAFLGGRAFAWKEDIGYNQLVAEYGAEVPDGSNIRVAIVEAYRGDSYSLDPSKPKLAGKEVIDQSWNPTSYSNHAYEVARRLATVDSIVPAIPVVHVFEANHWMQYVAEKNADGPVDRDYDIYNHSWVSLATSSITNKWRRTDYIVDAYDVFIAVGLDNFQVSMPLLVANTYNTITVGSSTGDHSVGDTLGDVAGRTKPDIVGTRTWTSYATPIVNSCAALLLSKAKQDPELASAVQPEAIKAILMAGATKEEFPDWTHTQSIPLDQNLGSGEVNIYHAYRILIGGHQQPNAGVNQSLGWDYRFVDPSSPKVYLLDGTSVESVDLSAVLTWNRKVTPYAEGNWGIPNYTIENLDLRLWRSNSNGDLVELIWSSQSEIDNNEHVYQTGLPAGHYALEVVNNTSYTDYAIAWRSNIPLSDSTDNDPAESVTVALSGISDGEEISIGTSATVTVSQSGAVSSVQKVELFESGSLLATDTTSPYSFAWAASMIGERQISAYLTTELGTYSQSIAVLVNDDDLSPSLTSPTQSTYSFGETIAIEAIVATDHGTVANVEFYANDLLIGSDAFEPYSISWTPIEAGVYSLKAIAVNGSEINFASSTVEITVDPSLPPASPSDLGISALSK